MATTDGADPRGQRSDHELDDAARVPAHSVSRPNVSVVKTFEGWDSERFASERAIGLFLSRSSRCGRGAGHRADKEVCR
jgi:hypothetical protein